MKSVARQLQKGLALIAAAGLGWLAASTWLGPAGSAAPPAVASAPTPLHLPGLLSLPPTELARVDIASMNLLCAEGLPGAPALDWHQAAATLDQYAQRVKAETDRHLYRFRQNSAEFNHSEGYFRVLTLVTVLQQDFGVRYNPERIQAPNFADARDLFLHGLLSGPRQGTCVSLPVLYVAVGRRLGYPLRLVTAKAHLFARWESPEGSERFNIEATNAGLNCFPDDHYHTWPVPLTAAEVAAGHYLKSLTPAEEQAVFLSARGHCLEAAGRLPEAQLAYAQAHVLAPSSPLYLACLASAVRQEMPAWARVQVDLGGTRPPATSAP
jgi:hypothetical protein